MEGKGKSRQSFSILNSKSLKIYWLEFCMNSYDCSTGKRSRASNFVARTSKSRDFATSPCSSYKFVLESRRIQRCVTDPQRREVTMYLDGLRPCVFSRGALIWVFLGRSDFAREGENLQGRVVGAAVMLYNAADWGVSLGPLLWLHFDRIRGTREWGLVFNGAVGLWKKLVSKVARQKPKMALEALDHK